MTRRLVVIANKNLDLTLDQVLDQLAMEFSVSKGELREWIPNLEQGWNRLSFFNTRLAAGRGNARVLKRLRKRLRPRVFGVSG